VDGKAFHTYTRGCKRPFDENFIAAMDRVTLALCKEIEGAAFAYVQSDEISVLVHNYVRLRTQAWFGNQVQKIVSVAASVAAATMTIESHGIFGVMKRALFDARAFVLPEAEVCNYFLWRQQDASRNSVQMLARSLCSHTMCENKDNASLQEMCFLKGHNWNDLPTHQRRGRCAYRVTVGEDREDWRVDNDIPLFNNDRSYVERHLATLE
jgi:tRNA(His) 5'-end guanylyltransferase